MLSALLDFTLVVYHFIRTVCLSQSIIWNRNFIIYFELKSTYYGRNIEVVKIEWHQFCAFA